jgi:putative transposase
MSLFKDKYKTESNRLQNWDYSSGGIYFITLVSYNRECIFGTIDSDLMILNNNGKIIENEIIKSIDIRDNWIFHNWIIMPNHIHLLIEIQTVDTQSIDAQPVETHRSASTPSISNNIGTHVANAHCGTSSPSISNNTETHVANTYIAETHCGAPLQKQDTNQSILKPSRKSNSISSFIAIFKSVTTKQILSLNDIEGVDVLARASARMSIEKTFVSRTPIWQSNYHDHIVRNYKSLEKIDSYITNNPANWDSDSINILNANTSI